MNVFHRLQGNKGFAIISAIVLVVVLAALGVAVMTISSTEQIDSAMDMQGARAYQAARSGIEWGSYKVWSSNTSTRNSATCPAASTSFKMPSTSTLSAFTVTVQCTATADATYGGPTVFTIISTACNIPNGGACPGAASSVGGLNYVERRITVTL
jgi:MSHA biogenesis protein MshP